MRNKAFLLVTVAALLAMVFVPAGAQERAIGPITERIIERGSLICGVNPALPGFGSVNDAGEYSGFDVDVCRAVAAAILGDADAVTFRPTNAAERPTVLASGEVDLLSRNTTKTLSRETDWGA